MWSLSLKFKYFEFLYRNDYYIKSTNYNQTILSQSHQTIIFLQQKTIPLIFYMIILDNAYFSVFKKNLILS